MEVRIHCPSRTVAEAIAHTLVTERLGAAANVGGELDSTYRWQGRVTRRAEVAVVIRTRAALFDALAQRVETLHPYDTPSVVAFEVCRVSAAYRDWLLGETRASP